MWEHIFSLEKDVVDLVKFKLVYPIKVNNKEFYTLIQKKDNKYTISLYLGDKMLRKPRESKARSLHDLVSELKGIMNRFFYTKLSQFVGEESGDEDAFEVI